MMQSSDPPPENPDSSAQAPVPDPAKPVLPENVPALGNGQATSATTPPLATPPVAADPSPADQTDAGETSVRYRIRHQTRYSYAGPVAVCQNQLRMRPRPLPTVQVLRSGTTISPNPDSQETHIDYFGNEVETFSIEALHDVLVVDVDSEVQVTSLVWNDQARGIRWKQVCDDLATPIDLALFDVAEFRFASPVIPIGARYRQYAQPSFDAHESLYDAVEDLTRRIHADFRYDTTATNVDTPVHQSFDLKAGVCQDFAQVQIACLRSMGLAARYVSGYLRTLPPPGKEKLVGADESHAWLSVFMGLDHGWLDLDPTNGCIAGRDHIPICLGRDYRDVSPMRGVAIGGGTADLYVSVDVAVV
ncbi:transglutaminase family protein [Crateriforma spongiae]|uniref:transglutaminase family protein n=1 Tax=Crateriforma spongiae TaxID=2724528 RepID=UPI001F42CE0C|nr:transglutaminase family protein [Crateriforma spongiae]